MRVLGLTGGIGMGKSTVARLAQEMGLPVVDTDALAHQLVEPGQPALNELKEAFGEAILASDGSLRRDVLASIVFTDLEARRRLEAILHPRIRTAWVSQVQAWRAEKCPIGLVVIPLLFETNAAGSFDATICVACSAATQQKRLLDRGWTPEQITQRCQAQWPPNKKMASADFVIWTEASLDVDREQLGRILAAESTR
jgi:dephospho-CoA kinase